MADLVHHMGGGIRRDVSAKVTHLVAMRTGGEKYRVSATLLVALIHSTLYVNALLLTLAFALSKVL